MIDRKLSIIYAILQLPLLFWLFWSFKLHEANLTLDDAKEYIRAKAPDLDTLTFDDVDVKRRWFFLHSPLGVCPFGKTSSILLALFAISVSVSLFFINEKEQLRNLLITACSVFGLAVLLTMIMNFPLFLRALPYFIVQAGLLGGIYAYYRYKKN